MPAEITARSKVDISRVARLFRAQFCRSAVADNTLTIKQKSTLPVSKTRQDKSLFCSLSGVYLPPLTVSCTLAVVRPSVARPPQPHPAPHGSLRHPPLPGVSRFRRIGSHLRRVTQAPGPALWQRALGTGSLLRCFCVEQEAARSRCAAQQDIPAVPYR